MIYIYCTRPSGGAKELVDYINGHGGKAKRIKKGLPPVKPGDVVVNWGSGGLQGVGGKILNRSLSHNKYNELVKLKAAGVPVPDHSRSKPMGDGWLARAANHTEAKDLLAGIKTGDYYTRYVPTVREFRIHVFEGASIRAGIKVPRVASPHPKFRSYTGGWKLDYGADCQAVMRQRYRDVAKAAVAALGYDFGAVDIGVTSAGEAVVFEVNSAPGLEGHTIEAYGNKLIGFSGRG